MFRHSFVTTPYLDVDFADLRVIAYTSSGGDTSVVFELCHGMTMHVYDPALLMRLAEVVAQGRNVLDRVS